MSYRYKELKIGSRKIFLVSVIDGLASEAARVRKAINELLPQAVALQTSKEELEELLAQRNEFYLPIEQEIYAHKLALYGEVRIPWPWLEEAVNQAKNRNLPMEQVDFTEEEYASCFVSTISTVQLLRYHLRLRRLRRKKFRSKTAENFVYEWDRALTKLKGYRTLELKREEHIAKKIAGLSKKYSKILAFVELQREEGIERKLRLLLSSRQEQPSF